MNKKTFEKREIEELEEEDFACTRNIYGDFDEIKLDPWNFELLRKKINEIIKVLNDLQKLVDEKDKQNPK